MASGILGQSAPTANTNTTVYTVPALTTSTFSVSICNTGINTIIARLAIAASATPGASEFLEYDAMIPANGVLERTGLVAQAAKLVVVRVSSTTAAVSIFGFEEV